MSNTESVYGKYCDGRFPLPSEEDVIKLETRLGVSLPPEYRQYILNYNGGYFSDPTIVSTNPDCPEDGLSTLWGIHAPLPFAELGHDVINFDDNTPAQILPIGDTTRGNLLFIVTHPRDYGNVCMKIAFSSNAFFLAESLEEFFLLITEVE